MYFYVLIMLLFMVEKYRSFLLDYLNLSKAGVPESQTKNIADICYMWQESVHVLLNGIFEEYVSEKKQLKVKLL